MLLMSQFCLFWTAFRTPSLGCQCVCRALWGWFPPVRLLECLHLVIPVSVSIWILTTIFLPLALSPIVRTLIFSSCWSFWLFTKWTNDNFFLSTFCTNSKFTGTCERVLHCLLWTYNSLLRLWQWFVFAVFYTPFKSFFVALTYSIMTSWIDFLGLNTLIKFVIFEGERILVFLRLELEPHCHAGNSLPNFLTSVQPLCYREEERTMMALSNLRKMSGMG